MAPILRTLVPVTLLIAVLSIGCKSSSVPASVEGNVTYNDAPVTGGTITFHPLATDVSGEYSARISNTGTYKCMELPTGEMAVTVETEFVNAFPDRAEGEKQQVPKDDHLAKDYWRPRMGSGPMPKTTKGEKAGLDARASYLDIPSKYSDVKKTPLKTKLIKGKNEYDALLED
jgi:hypothetical protein